MARSRTSRGSRASRLRGAPVVSSTPILFAAVLLAGSATALILLRHPVIAGGVAVAAGAAVVRGWYVAQLEGDGRSRFVSMLVDPLHDSALLAAIAWAAHAKHPAVSALALVALGLSYLSAYERAKADALGFRTFESVGYRAAKSMLIAVGLLSGRMSIALWLLIVLTGAAVVARAANVTIQHRQDKRRSTRSGAAAG